jgi:hypothetical protein
MLPDAGHYVKKNGKNTFSMTFLSIGTDILHFPQGKDRGAFSATFSKGGALLRFSHKDI